MLPPHDPIYDDLLTNPPGTYALTPYGRTHAVILKGDAEFRAKGFNLFTSFGCERDRPIPQPHDGIQLNTIFFGMPIERVQIALRLYLFARLVRANTRDVLDEEGDFVEVVCDREETLWEEADQLAVDFMVTHMHADYRALPVYEELTQLVVSEHGFGSLGAAHESE